MRAGFDCHVTAAFLESGRTMSNAANTAALIAGIASISGTAHPLLAVSLIAWPLQTWYAVRVAIDRRLFETLATEPAEAAGWLDALLVDWKLHPAAPPRSLTGRSRGALRLLRLQSAALAVQLAALAGALALRAVSR